MRSVLGIDAGGTKTLAILADESGQLVATARDAGANLKTSGELEVEKVLYRVIERCEAEAAARPDAVAIGIAGADRPRDRAILSEILRRIGFPRRVVITNDAHIAFVAGSASRIGLAVVCGTGSIAWGQNAAGQVARAGGWGWHLGDEGSGFWIGERAIRAVLRAEDGRSRATALTARLLEHFGIARAEEIVDRTYGRDYPRHDVAMFSLRVGEVADQGDPAAREILDAAAEELRLAARTVRDRLSLEDAPYDVVLSGGTFRGLPSLERAVASALTTPNARVRTLEEEPAMGAVKLALEQLRIET